MTSIYILQLIDRHFLIVWLSIQNEDPKSVSKSCNEEEKDYNRQILMKIGPLKSRKSIIDFLIVWLSMQNEDPKSVSKSCNEEEKNCNRQILMKIGPLKSGKKYYRLFNCLVINPK